LRGRLMQTHGEFAMNKKEIALLQKIAGGGTMDDHEIDSVMGQIAELRNTDLQHSPEHKFAPSGAAEAAAAVVATGPEDGNSSEGDDNDGEDHNPYNPFAEHMPGAPADAEVVSIDPGTSALAIGAGCRLVLAGPTEAC